MVTRPYPGTVLTSVSNPDLLGGRTIDLPSTEMIKTGFLTFILGLRDALQKQQENIKQKQEHLEILYLYFSFIL